jgi:protein-disulfide isomerase
VVALLVLIGIGVAAMATRKGRQGAGDGTASPPVPATPGPGLPLAVDQEPDLLIPARTKGDSAAPITIYEVADFQCPACREFWKETLPGLEREYIRTGKARIVFINFPIASIHRNAIAAHVVAMCAAQHGRFWTMHDLLYEQQLEWGQLADPQPLFRRLGAQAGLSADALQSCETTGRARFLVDAETETLARAGVRSTPSFIVQGALLAGAAPLAVWRPILDSIYAAVAAGR